MLHNQKLLDEKLRVLHLKCFYKGHCSNCFTWAAVVLTASPQNERGRSDWESIVWTISWNVQFLLSTTPFCWGVLGVENWLAMPYGEQKRWKACEINSPLLFGSDLLNFLWCLFLEKSYPFLKFGGGLRSFCNQVNPNITWETINDKHEISCTTKSSDFHWTTKIHVH